MQDFLKQTYLGNTVLRYLLFLAAIVLSALVILILKHVLLKRLERWSAKTSAQFADTFVTALRKYLMPLIYLGAFFLCTEILVLGPIPAKIISILAVASVTIFSASLASSVLAYGFNKYWEKKDENADRFALKIISRIIKALIWIIAVLLFLDNVGVEISALVASLGIGSVAVAFAAQAILEDIFSFFAIFLDRPFETGDFINVGDLMGTVEHVGVKTTRLRSLSGEQLIFSNKDLTSSRVKNYKRMENRRVSFRLKVTYRTTLDELKTIPSLVKGIIESMPDVRFDRAHFCEFANYSLDFEIVYYILSSDYNKFMDIQQEIYFRIKEQFEQRGIEFAYPTQTLYLHNPE